MRLRVARKLWSGRRPFYRVRLTTYLAAKRRMRVAQRRAWKRCLRHWRGWCVW